MELLFGDVTTLLKALGILGVFFIVFAESGLLIGILLPGDTLLLTAGILASQGYFPITLLILAACAGAILGDNVGYAFGKKVGPAIFWREDSLVFHKSHLDRAARFYERFGGITIVYARFIPVVRTFAPILAGVGRMRYKTFFFYNVIGALLWAAGVPLAGYFLGSFIQNIERYIGYLIIGLVAVTVLPPLFHVLLKKDDRRELFERIKNFFSRGRT